jgi:hypothetical protein
LIADVPRVKLSELVGRFGIGLSGDARRSKALLADVCGDGFRGECAVLVAAVEEGVAGELLSSSSGLPTEVLLGRLSDRLQANRGVSSDLARWGVESWAVALGVVAGGNTLATFKMDGLAPLIDLAGADGTITDAELNHLVLEAKTHGVSEADARAYLSNYAAARGWHLGNAPAGPGRARPQAGPGPPGPQTPPPPRSPQPQPPNPPGPASPQPTSAHARSSAFRWVAASVIGLAAIAIIVVAVRVNEQPQLPPPAPPSATAPAPAPVPDARQQQQRRAELADREQRTYNAARGNLSALRAYVNACTVCAFEADARSEISRLQTADQEERTYNASRGNQYALQAYVNTCTVCTFARAARTEIATLEAAQPKRRASSIVICGRPVNYVVDATGAAEPYRSFLGVWTGAAWNSRICGGPIVGSVENDGTARITYIYGPLPGSQFSWKQQSPTAVIRNGQLTFQDEEAGNFIFRLSEQNMLRGHFTSARGVTLDAVLTRDLSSVPQ